MLTEQALLDDIRLRNDEKNDRNRRAAVFLVEATDYESRHLWVDYSEESARYGWGDIRIPRVPWEQITLGYGKGIGQCAGMPVYVSVTFAKIHHHVVAFYEATSQVVDHRMVERWLKTEFPAARGKTNPSNFHLCLYVLKELVSKAGPR